MRGRRRVSNGVECGAQGEQGLEEWEAEHSRAAIEEGLCRRLESRSRMERLEQLRREEIRGLRPLNREC